MLNNVSVRSERVLVCGLVAAALLTGGVWLVAQGLRGIELAPDRGAAWYYWKLPEPTVWTRLSAWLGYAAHQVVSWGLIFYAQTRVRRYSRALKPVNFVALGATLGFIGLHAVQTRVFYDGLAQDVSIFSSQGSVVLLLVLVLLMENRRRGLFVGRAIPIPPTVTGLVRRYHGYLFSWAAIYTFWYHPMEGTSGHLIGFFYMFLLLLQSCLVFTTVHTNRWWTMSLEVVVAVHGTLVAVMNSGPDGAWPMFLFGFLAIFVLTQMHGLGLRARTRWVLAGGYLAAIVVTYSWRGFGNVDEVVRIPVIEYLLLGVLAVLIWLGVVVARRFAVPARTPAHAPETGGQQPQEAGNQSLEG